MAIIYTQKYPNRFDAISTSYPQGKFRDRSSDDAHDGSYFQQDWMNDHVGFFGALLKNGGVTPDGTVDTALNSQYYKALLKVITNSLGDYRKKDDLVFKGLMQVHAPDSKGTGVFFIDDTGKPRGQVTSTQLGLQFAQHHVDGSSQTFTLPKTEGELVVDAQLERVQTQVDAKQSKLEFDGTGNVVRKSVTDDLNATIIDSTPVGIIHAYVSENPPNDTWLLCRGQTFSGSKYPLLAEIFPDLRVPDLRGVALRGLDAGKNYDPDRKLLSYQEDAMQRIYGNILNLAHGKGKVVSAEGAFSRSNGTDVGNAQGGGATNHITFDSTKVTRTNTQDETVMKNVAVNFIIKAK